ncbi:putative membrane protein YczE [Lactobacillus colini]|uniref:Membrane protein YczE n=1 Tax=Lactobacillus colini TaxID=1819254 RepID=A0ABS4MEU7_9LACO|nr:hypothetical protein [Lactobacillus colini]MBP2058210.1 putative membrane protein YczE [Lactobacillus colini]
MKCIEKPSKGFMIFAFVLSLFLNGVGNGLTVALNLGSALWTAAATNLSHTFGLSIADWLMIDGTAVIVVILLITREFNLIKIIGYFIFMIPFSYLVSFATNFFINIGINNLNLPVRIALDLFGIYMISVSVSLYQRVNWVLHPIDDLMQVLRFYFFKGNSVIAQWVNFIPPIVLTIVCLIISHHMYAINIGTIISLIFQGTFIGWTDKHLFPHFAHQNLKLRHNN